MFKSQVMNVIITGASRGIGKAIAQQFAANGHQLFLCSRNEEALNKTREALLEAYPGAKIKVKARDLSNKEEAENFGQWIVDNGYPIDVLVNNAGYFLPGKVHQEPEGLMEEMMSINFYSAYYLSRKIIPIMIRQKQGHIFNICSIASLKAYPNGGSYSVSKFALMGFSQNLREELKEHHIKVTAVVPGAVMTDSWGDFDNSNNRIMEPGDVAKMVYAASQLSPQACVEDIVLRPQLGDL